MQSEILLIEQQDYWRNFSGTALIEAGFTVRMVSDYKCFWMNESSQECFSEQLTVLGCAKLDSEEIRLIERLLQNRHRLLVLCASLTWQDRRSLFLSGAADVADRPFQSDDLVALVKDAIRSISSRDSYRIAEQEGLP